MLVLLFPRENEKESVRFRAEDSGIHETRWGGIEAVVLDAGGVGVDKRDFE